MSHKYRTEFVRLNKDNYLNNASLYGKKCLLSLEKYERGYLEGKVNPKIAKIWKCKRIKYMIIGKDRDILLLMDFFFVFSICPLFKVFKRNFPPAQYIKTQKHNTITDFGRFVKHKLLTVVVSQ